MKLIRISKDMIAEQDNNGQFRFYLSLDFVNERVNSPQNSKLDCVHSSEDNTSKKEVKRK